MKPPNKKQSGKIQKQKAALRASLWPKLVENSLWHFKATGGWLNIPRAMPLLLRIMDTLSKGKPVSTTYLDLWCRTFNDSFVIANKTREMAFYAGFNGERAERTWSDRMAILEKFGFIETHDGPHGAISYVLILNPFHVVKDHVAKGLIETKSYNALLERMIETGTDELADPETETDATEPDDDADDAADKPAAPEGKVTKPAPAAPEFDELPPSVKNLAKGKKATGKTAPRSTGNFGSPKAQTST